MSKNPPQPPSLSYALGRQTAPIFFKANWILKSLAGSETEKIRAEYQMGYLLAQAYEQNTEAFANQRLSAIAEKLTRCLRNPNRTHTFKLDRSEHPNARAIPGGFIYLSEQLFDRCGEDCDAVAFVLAHEIAHGIHGDANKRFLTRTAIQGLLRVQTRGISPALKQLLGHLAQQGYSREQEYRADRFAVALVKAAGFDPQGGCRLFARLSDGDQSARTAATYFSSHPAMNQRIARINQRINPT